MVLFQVEEKQKFLMDDLLDEIDEMVDRLFFFRPKMRTLCCRIGIKKYSRPSIESNEGPKTSSEPMLMI